MDTERTLLLKLANVQHNEAIKNRGGLRNPEQGPCVCSQYEYHEPPCLGPDCSCH